jgi:hypothetical protein
MTRFRLPLTVLLAFAFIACDSPAPSELDPSIRALLSGPLGVGDVEGFQGSFAERIAADGGSEGAEYLFVVTNASTAGGQSVSLSVLGEGVSAQQVRSEEPGPLAPNLELAPGAAEAHYHPRFLDDDQFHLELRRREARLVEELVGHLPDRGTAALLEAVPAPAPVPSVGEILELNVNASDPCANPIWRQGRVEAVSQQAVVVADLDNPDVLTRADFERIAQDFDEKVYPLSSRNFGEPARGIGPPRTTSVYTTAVNQLASGFGGLVGGFFFARDLFPRVEGGGFAGCPASNEREMFYMLTADPNGQHGQAIPVDFIRRRSITTVMHEHQHLVNASRRLFILSTGALEVVWLNEALSHIAEELLFYQEAGLQPGMNLNLDDVRASQARLDAVNNHQVPNLARYLLYLSDVSRNTPLDPQDGLEVRGASWSFLRYVADQHVDNHEQFFFQLVNSGQQGVENLRARLTRELPLPLTRWGISHFADDLVPGLAPVHRQPSWNFRSLLPELTQDGTFPLQATRLQPGTPVALTIRGGSSAFIRLGVPPGERATITTQSGGGAPPEAVRGSLLRVR